MKKKESILKQFSLLYIFFTFFPFLFIYFLFSLYDESGTFISLNQDRFFFWSAFLGFFALSGFFIMRASLKRLEIFTEHIKKKVLENVDTEVMSKLINEEGEIGELAKTFAQIIKRLDDNVQELEETKKTVNQLTAKVSSVLSSVESIDSLINLVLDTAIGSLGVNKGAIFSFEDGQYVLSAKVGMDDKVSRDNMMASAKAYLDLIAKENRIFILPAVNELDQSDRVFELPLLCNPLMYRGKMMGALLLCGKKQGENFSNDDLGIIGNLSNQIAIAFENARLNTQTEQTYFETMAALALAVEARDSYSRGHSDRVGEYARLIGLHMNLPAEDIKILSDASRLHDVGKIGIMDSILIKKEMLSSEEMDIMKQHPIIGESILMPLKKFKPLLSPIRHHHENLNGTGYPDGIQGNEIELITRILSIADIYDALTTDRPYRKSMDFVSTKKELQSLVSEGKIDGEIVSHLYALIDEGKMRVN